MLLLTFFITWYKDGKKSLDFDGIDIIENKFDKDNQPIIIDKIEIRIVLSKKELYGNKGSYKHYIGYRFKGCNMPK